MSEWSVAEPTELDFDDPVRELRVRIVGGTVNVVGTDESSARLEVTELEGPPLAVTQQDGTLTVAYEDLPWKGLLKWLDPQGWRRSAVVSLAVPARTRVEVGAIGAAAVVSGVDGPVELKGVSGDTTLVGLAGPVRADTVSGNLEAQALTGDLRFHSVSGDLTVVEAGSTVKADSVSGSMIVDLDPASSPTDICLTSVSGEIAIRLPQPADADVEANTASGTVSSAFEDLRVTGQWGAKRITGRLGTGSGRLRATTVSGSIALLRRPPETAQPWGTEPQDERPEGAQPQDERPEGAQPRDGQSQDTEPGGARPGGTGEAPGGPVAGAHEDTVRDDPGENAAAGPGGSPPPASAPADGTTDKKVL
ncbi:DUF4097 family beta strand repeat-containing protein [Streptomyces glaucescens]|uniref:DUF4097 domain-containing protein n=1 Tax=Streptomyces glaucescens TaxID=1907 RepID=A0A089XF13_STRGA|nr:DUF4097 family beta strand repeat-containing protein [Streptomyces glaucescens]AIS00492.1 hypothetical protein SGLAU_22710 [Streptomyces glaucescens]